MWLSLWLGLSLLLVLWLQACLWHRGFGCGCGHGPPGHHCDKLWQWFWLRVPSAVAAPGTVAAAVVVAVAVRVAMALASAVTMASNHSVSGLVVAVAVTVGHVCGGSNGYQVPQPENGCRLALTPNLQ